MIFYRFWIDLGSNLPANLASKSTQNRPKSHPNFKPTCIMFSIAFFTDFGSIFGRFWWIFGPKLRAKLIKKSIIWPLVGKLAEIIKKLKKTSVFFKVFWSLGLPTSKHN